MSRMERRQQEELRKLWEKESKRAAKSRFSVKRVIVSALIVVLVLGGAAAAYAVSQKDCRSVIKYIRNRKGSPWPMGGCHRTGASPASLEIIQSVIF